MTVHSSNSPESQRFEPDGEPSLGGGSSLPKASHLKPIEVFSAEVVLPSSVYDRVTFGDWLSGTLYPLKSEVISTFESTIQRIERLSDSERERLKGAIFLAADELLVNIACYGLGGISSAQRVAAYIDGSDEPELEAAIESRLADPEVRARRGSITLEVFEDRVAVTVFDGTPFPDFKERWARADEATLEENLLRRSGRGLFLLQSSGFTAEQAPSGAVTYTLRW